MADTPDFTQANLDAINIAIAQGAKEVWYGDKRVVYRSLQEMFQIRGLIQNSLGIPINSGRKYASFSKGLEPGHGSDLPDTSLNNF